jgi:hypothetical protein
MKTLGKGKFVTKQREQHARTTEILKSAFEMNTKARRIAPADREELTERIFSKDNQFQHQQVSLKIERFSNKRDTNKPPRFLSVDNR